jgi:hypothetical protein
MPLMLITAVRLLNDFFNVPACVLDDGHWKYLICFGQRVHRHLCNTREQL